MPQKLLNVKKFFMIDRKNFLIFRCISWFIIFSAAFGVDIQRNLSPESPPPLLKRKNISCPQFRHDRLIYLRKRAACFVESFTVFTYTYCFSKLFRRMFCLGAVHNFINTRRKRRLSRFRRVFIRIQSLFLSVGFIDLFKICLKSAFNRSVF